LSERPTRGMIASGAASTVTREPNENSFATPDREPSVYRHCSERGYHCIASAAWWAWHLVSRELTAVYAEGFREAGLPEV
jgi:hypothetical protein